MLTENLEFELVDKIKNPDRGYSALPNFSHIYIEEDAGIYPLTQNLIERFPRSKIIEIKNYKEIFNRSKQDWRSQKMSQKLILAKKRDGFLYEGSNEVQNFGYKYYYYNSLVLNCPYNCHYCYLQGMYPSANIVVFVNLDDFFKSTLEMLSSKGNLYLCISYDTDLLALESLLGYCKEWIKYTTNNKDLVVELRTKSINFKSIRELPPPKNFILAWTLSPEEVIKSYEPKTPSLEARIDAVREALHFGWSVRLCFDPILAINNWKKAYEDMFDKVRSSIPLKEIKDITLGVFRVNTQYFKDMKKRVKWPLFYEPFQKTSHLVTYDTSTQEELIGHMEELLATHYLKDRIFSHRA